MPLNLTAKVFESKILDEIFHIPAAQRYCDGNLSYWDPKITTPPGLYIFSSLIIKVAQLVSPDVSFSVIIIKMSLKYFDYLKNFKIECGIFELRSTNILVFVFLYFILKEFNTILHGSESASKRALIQGLVEHKI